MSQTGKTTIFFVLFTYAFTASLAQSIKVKSSEGLAPLSFASIVNVSKGKLYFSDQQGNVEGNFEIGDSIFITHVGYKYLRSKIRHLNEIFSLQQSVASLDTVRIQSCKFFTKEKISNIISDTTSKKFGGVCCWAAGETTAKVAVMLKSNFSERRLHSFSIWLSTAWQPKASIQTPMKFTFYSINLSTMLPGELISNQQIIYYPKKEGKQTINVDSINIWIQEPGIYLAMEYIYDKKYEWPQRYIDTLKGIDTVTMRIGSFIDGVYAKDFTLAHYNYKTDYWSFAGYQDKSTLNKASGTIKISAEITRCKEQNQ